MQDITGETGAASIWNMIMETLIQFEGYERFERPNGLVEKEVCAWDGFLPTTECTERYLETFAKGTEPTVYTTLKNKPDYIEVTDIQITSPKQDSVFEIYPKINNRVVFGIIENKRIAKVEWFLNGEKLSSEDCKPVDLTSCSWELVQGNHNVSATVYLLDNTQLNLPENDFSVILYRKGWE
jgi:penicillin-binding protein 1C